MAKILYVTNKELLKEIHKSKVSFCAFDERRYADFDAIAKKEEITQELIESVRMLKAMRLSKQLKVQVSIDDLKPEDIVLRVMTSEHIPLDPDRKKRGTGLPDHAKTTFPPFKHYILKNGDLVEVCRSHWTGDLQTGSFVAHKGMINDRLAYMMKLLVERYSSRGNWRGYSYVEEMRGNALMQLAQTGLQFDESKSDNPFAFYTTISKNCFRRILNTEKRVQTIRDDLLIMYGAAPSIKRQVDDEISHRFEEEAKKTQPSVEQE